MRWFFEHSPKSKIAINQIITVWAKTSNDFYKQGALDTKTFLKKWVSGVCINTSVKYISILKSSFFSLFFISNSRSSNFSCTVFNTIYDRSSIFRSFWNFCYSFIQELLLPSLLPLAQRNWLVHATTKVKLVLNYLCKLLYFYWKNVASKTNYLLFFSGLHHHVPP